jgi:hypothetical protein
MYLPSHSLLPSRYLTCFSFFFQQVYTSRNHPNLAEALIHAYFQMVGYPHTMCVLLELLAKTVVENHSKFWDSLIMLPDRYALFFIIFYLFYCYFYLHLVIIHSFIIYLYLAVELCNK